MRLIDADALKDKLQQHYDFYVMAWGGFGKMPIGEKKRVDEINNCIGEVVNAPTIEPKRGEWIDKDGVKKCNLCGWLTTNQGYAFCPNCGTDMRIVESKKVCGNCAFVDNDPNLYPCRYCAKENRIYWRAK